MRVRVSPEAIAHPSVPPSFSEAISLSCSGVPQPEGVSSPASDPGTSSHESVLIVGPSTITFGSSDPPVGAGSSALKSGFQSLMVWNVLSGKGGRVDIPRGIDRARVRCCLARSIAFLASWITPFPVQIFLPWVKSYFPRPESKYFLQESEVIRSHHSSPGTFCRRPSKAGCPKTQIKSREQAFPAAWGNPCPALHNHCPAPALPGAAVSPPQGCWACRPP